MSYEITEYDKRLIRQNVLKFKVRITALDYSTNMPLSVIEGGIISGSSSVDAESDIRRTFSLTLSPTSQSGLTISENGLIWLNKKIKLEIGICDMYSNEYTYWSQGIYVIMNSSMTYDAENNTIQMECSDMMAYLDGSRNGNLGQEKIVYPAYDVTFDIFNASVTYYKGEMAIYNDSLYVLSKKDTFRGAFSTSYWKIYAEKYDGRKAYKVNDKCFYAGTAYKCKKAISGIDDSQTARTFSFSQWTKINSAGEPRKYYYVRDQLINAITQLGRIKEYQIDDIGEAKAQPNYSIGWDYKKYRQERMVEATDGNKYCQCLATPYDLEFTSGTTVLSIITEMRDLYENYEAYFDENGIFICKMIPSGDDDPVMFSNSFLKSILVSENTQIDFTEVKNVTEAWGKTYDPEWFSSEIKTANDSENGCYYNGNTYYVQIEGYTDEEHLTYYNNDEIAIRLAPTNSGTYVVEKKIPGTQTYYNYVVPAYSNVSPCYLCINSKDPNYPLVDDNNKEVKIPIYDYNTDKLLEAGVMRANEVYSFRIKKEYDIVAQKEVTKAYFEGNWQAHAMDVLTDGSVGESYVTSSGKNVNRYSIDYFKEVYNCTNIHFTVIPDSPFTVQKLGEILNVYNNENMTSDTLAIEGAIQENYRKNRLTDKISITTKLCPFADVNIKVSYQRSDKDVIDEYLVKHIEHNWTDGTTQWDLVKYYRLYLDTEQ